MRTNSTLQSNSRRLASGSFTHLFLICLGVLPLAIGLSGCASLQGKFTRSTKTDVGYFADQTIALLSKADFDFTRDESVYTREYFDDTGEEERELIRLEDEVDLFFKDIITYSFNIVVIYETNKDDEKRIKAYAKNLQMADEKVLQQLNLPREAFDNVIEDILKQNTFREALQAAQPIINGAGWYMNTTLNELMVAVSKVALKMDQKIDEEYADVIRYQEKLEEEKYAILSAFEALYETYRGDQGAYSTLKANRAIRRKDLLPQKHPTDKQLEAIAEHLSKRLKALDLVGKAIQSDWDTYRATHRELDKLYDMMMESIRTARLLTIVWVNAHYEMARGVSAPAEWFDVENAGAVAVKTGLKVVF